MPQLCLLYIDMNIFMYELHVLRTLIVMIVWSPGRLILNKDY